MLETNIRREGKKLKAITVTIAVLILVLVAVSITGCGSGEKKVIHFGSSAGENGNFLGIVAIAKELGYIDEELGALGFEVEYSGFANGVAVNEGITAGEVDLSTLGDVPTAVGIANDIGLTWIGVGLSSYNNAIVVSADSDIQTPEDLSGKKVALGVGTSCQYLWESVVTEFGIDVSNVEILNLGTSDSISALSTGNTDAVVLGENYAKVLEADGTARILVNTEDYPQWAPQDMIVGRTEFLEENPEVGVALHKALIRAKEEFIKNPEKYYVTLSAKQIEEYPELGAEIYNRDNGEFANLITEITESNLEREQKLADFLYSIERITTQANISGSLDNSYYEKAKQELEAE